MRVVPFFIALICVVVGTVLAYDLWSNRRPSSTPEPGPTPSAPEPNVAGAGRSKSDATSTEKPAAKTVRRSADPVELGRITRALSRWQTERADRSYLDRFSHEDRVRDLLAEWDIKNSIRSRTSKQRRPIPDRVHRVRLDNGKVLWARETRKSRGKVEVTMMNDIRASFPEYQVEKDETVPGHVYAKETSRDYEKQLLDLRDTPRQLLRGIGMALAREDLDRVERFYKRWLDSGGAEVLARDLSNLESERLLAAARQLGVEKPKVIAAAKSSTRNDGDTRLENLEPLPEPPADEDELRRRMNRFNSHLKRSLSSSKRQRLLDELLVCERWLEEKGSEAIGDGARLKQYQQDIQFLRLDLLKAGGF